MMREIIVDSFAGGGGASLGIEMALGISPDIAINHDADALRMHEANHPHTLHLPHNVWKVDPTEVTRGRRVGLLWASPDCKHFSKAKGGKPVARNIRDLAWVVVRWAKQVRPRVIILENVEEFREWGPLGEDNRPCPERKGETFRRWVGELKRLGYRVEWRELRACDYGAPTIRKRFFLIARCDGQKIVWPKPTHGDPKGADVKAGKLLPWVPASAIIDWSVPTHSIFLSREEGRAVGCNRPLAEATMARIARGVKRYVLDAAEPFIVSVAHGDSGGRREYPIDDPLGKVTSKGNSHALVTPFVTKFNTGSTGHSLDDPLATVTANSFIDRPGGAAPIGLVAPVLTYAQHGGAVRSPEAPLHTVTASKKDQNALIVPTLIQTGYGERAGQEPRVPGLEKPLGTIVAGAAKHALVSAFLAQHNTGLVGHDAREPVSTIVQKGCTQALVAAHLMTMRNSGKPFNGADEPTHTITAGGAHLHLVAAFLQKYYGTDQDPRLDAPVHTATTKDRFGLVTVEIGGEPFVIADIGMRMLTPRELFRAQSFPDSYKIDADAHGVPITKTKQISNCGNSVPPLMARALVAANYAVQEVAPREAVA